MKLEAVMGDRIRRLEIRREGPELRLVEDGSNTVVDIVEVRPRLFSVLVDGASLPAAAEEISPGRFVVAVRGRRVAVALRDPRAYRRADADEAAAGSQELRTLMPGKVVRVLVAEGAEVAAGQGLLVVEAMKMQNEMKAPRAGRVVAVRAGEGVSVSAGEVLVVVE